jgi:polysaccharide pyruvyl transferase WcaK-like protein
MLPVTPPKRIEIIAPGDKQSFDLDHAFDAVDVSRVETLCLAPIDATLTSAVAESLLELVDRLPFLQAVSVRFVEANAPVNTEPVLALSENALRRGRRFQAEFVLGDDADASAALDSDDVPFTSTLAASRTMRDAGVSVCWLVPARPALTFNMEGLFSLARDERVDPILVPAGSWPLSDSLTNATFTDDERLFLWDFVSYRLLDEDRSFLPPARISLYETLRLTLEGQGSPALAKDASTEVLVAHTSDGHDWALRNERRLDPQASRYSDPQTPAETAGSAPSVRERAGDLAQVLSEGRRALGQWAGAMLAGAVRRDTRPGQERRLPSVLIIGAYGGEHIGDAAILGGVLFRIHRRYGTTRAIVLSQRPRHTRHLVPMLDTPVEVTVEGSEPSRARHLVRQVDAVVYAGGPLTDLPKQLVRHFYTVSLARRAGKPFIAEGIGAGPFVMWPSEWTGRRIVRMAERIAVRTSDDAKARIVRDLSPETGRDPAFDYLETRGHDLTRLADVDRRWIERLFKDIEGRMAIGLNLRPIRAVFTAGVPAAERIARTRFVEARFEQEFADGLRRFSEAAASPPCFVFYPMNPNQFGHSDLRSAYRLKRLLGPNVDFRIWQADAGLDGVVALLRRMDAVISMRFHATIFALSQGRPAIGIDYRVGQRDKVAALLADFGQSENCGRIDEVTSTWLYEHLRDLVGGKGPREARSVTS